MADVKWIKLPTDIFDSEKVRELEKYNDCDAYICLWMRILCHSKKSIHGQKEFKIANIELTDAILQTVFRYKDESIGKALQILERNGFIQRHKNSIVCIPFWKSQHDRNTTRYKHWRNTVFERDGFLCQVCGTKKDIQAHHIIAWKDCKNNTDLRYATDNGITLCRACHLEAHGGRWNG